jgi:parallel beta-helix repeat protein
VTLTKRTALALILALLFSAMALKLSVRFASAQTEFVAIKAEGSVEPSTAPIQRVGDLYTLTGDIGEIWIGRSNITLDGNGYTVTKTYAEKKVNLYSVKNVTVKNLTVKGGACGIFLDRASNVTVSNNTVEGTRTYVPFTQYVTSGIYVWGGGNNIIVGNRLENNRNGISLSSIEPNIIRENNITGNSLGIWFRNASNNVIYHNNFINNDVHVVDFDARSTPSLNTWDGGLYSGGNFWSDYHGTDENGDGIGDKSYKVDDNNQDLYPLMKPWHPTIPFDTVPPRISIVSPVHKVYNDSSVQLTFSIYESASSMSYSLDGQDNVTIAGNTTLDELPNGSHNLTVYVTDLSGNTGVSEISYFSVDVPEPFPTTLVAASVITVAVIGIGLLVYFRKRQKESGDKA